MESIGTCKLSAVQYVSLGDDGGRPLAQSDTVNEPALTDRMWVVWNAEIGNGRAGKPWKYHYGCQLLQIILSEYRKALCTASYSL